MSDVFRVGDRVEIFNWHHQSDNGPAVVVEVQNNGGVIVEPIEGSGPTCGGWYPFTNVRHAANLATAPAPAPQQGGMRFDAGKLRLDLIPLEWRVELGRVTTVGAIKYLPRNFEQGMPWSKVLGSMHRHAACFENGESVDPETKCHHLAMVAWNALALMSYELRGVGENDLSQQGLYGAGFALKDSDLGIGMTPEEIQALAEKYKAQRGE